MPRLCGCGEMIELLVLDGAKPRWDVLIDRNNSLRLNLPPGGGRVTARTLGSKGRSR